MALISCPDCGRQVSSLAKACPDCARPIADDVEVRALERRRARDHEEHAEPGDVGEKVNPGELARQHRDRVGVRAPGVEKKCVRCGRDVSEDLFRAKDERGYTCADCQDAAIGETVEARARWSRVLWAVLVVAFIGVAVVGALSMGSVLATKSAMKK